MYTSRRSRIFGQPLTATKQRSASGGGLVAHYGRLGAQPRNQCMYLHTYLAHCSRPKLAGLAASYDFGWVEAWATQAATTVRVCRERASEQAGKKMALHGDGWRAKLLSASALQLQRRQQSWGGDEKLHLQQQAAMEHGSLGGSRRQCMYMRYLKRSMLALIPCHVSVRMLWVRLR